MLLLRLAAAANIVFMKLLGDSFWVENWEFLSESGRCLKAEVAAIDNATTSVEILDRVLVLHS